MTSALQIFGDRPQWVPSPDGPGRDCVAIHDQEHIRLRREWKRKRAEAHDDAGGFTFRRVQRDYDRWLADETAWYSHRGLTVPDYGRRVDPPTVALVPRVGKKPPQTLQRLMTYLADGQIHSADTCAAALGITRGNVITGVSRLRTRGYDIVMEARLGTRPAGYRYRGADRSYV
jgi:biotin operon repressor